MSKSTEKILEELKFLDDFNSFYNENKDNMVKCGLKEMLDRLIKEKGLKKSEIIKNSELSEVYAYQIFSGLRTPTRKKLLCLAIGMGLNFEEIQNLLKSSGYPYLYSKLAFDSVIIYGICKKLSVMEINELLFDYDLETLG